MALNIADTKAGLGDADKSKAIEDMIIPMLILSSIFVSSSIFLIINKPIWMKILLAILFFALSFIVLSYFGLNASPSNPSY